MRIDSSVAHLNRIQPPAIPELTPTGFAVCPVPSTIFELLAFNFERRRCAGDLTAERRGNVIQGSEPLWISQEDLNAFVLHKLQPLHEEWCGQALIPSSAYGLRVYQAGSRLVPHVDRFATHIISSIVHISHDLDEPWPLSIVDHQGRRHDINLEPGQMLFYESARLIHGRLPPLRGRHYCSLFLHYRPIGWDRGVPRIRAAIAHRLNALETPVPVQEQDSGLSAADRQHLIDLARETLETTGVVGDQEREEHASRVSDGGWLASDDPVVARLEQLAARLTGLPVQNQERVQIIRYIPGGMYRAHHDFFSVHTEGGRSAVERGGQRVFTVIVYLNDGYVGGLTHFPRMDTTIYPTAGRVIWWPNATDGELLERSLHEGTPVEEGEKWIATIWIRESAFRREG